MTDRQQRFIAEYVACMNAAEAARKAGYSEKTANRIGARLLTNVVIRQKIDAQLAKGIEKAELTAERTLEELRRLAFSDIRQLFDADGNLKRPGEWTNDAAAAVAGLEVVKRNLTSGDGQSDTVYKLKVWDKSRNLENLAKHFGLLLERVQHSGEVSLVERLQAARKRGE